MMTSPPAITSADSQSPFELKGSLFTLTVVHLRQGDPVAIDRHLADKVRQAPGFFSNAPAVLDLEDLAAEPAPDFARLCQLFKARGLVPMGVRNGTDALQAAAVLAGLPVLPEGRSQGSKRMAAVKSEPERRHSRLITQPVRSGQQIYAAEGDLILMGAVSAGAEVLADGHIHIYGSLRGRALAGAKGDPQARIFCQNLEAELVSIAGRYRLLEELDPEARGKPVQLYLQEDRLIIEPLVK
ncbi:MAG: septum site-determining protein MinC [Candidatus Competibacteraceae bacterium]|nr:septum site-determining protein MinC [Candidatus Competibacteraceae bacterium]